MTKTYAIVAGGGTAGHVNPALAIADAMVARGHDRSTIHFVGSKRGLEASLVPSAGYGITLLSGRGIVRQINKDSIFAVLGLAAALVRAIAVVARRRPSVVVSVGGYAGAPCAVAAALLRVPLVLAESNAVPGASNRLVARVAKACAVALPGTPLPRAVVTGNPVRKEISSLDRSPEGRAASRAALGLPADRVIVAAFGGSLGALSINKAVVELAHRWVNRGDLAIYHVLGSRDWTSPAFERVDADAFAKGKLLYFEKEYESDMANLLNAADALICRAGATTVAEICASGTAAVFVPLPNAPGDHQTMNARALEKVGAAVVVPDNECDGPHLDSALAWIVASEETRAAMGDAAYNLAVPDAADKVAALAEQYAKP